MLKTKLRTYIRLTLCLLLLAAFTQIFAFQPVNAQTVQNTPAYISSEFTSGILGSATLVSTIVEFDTLPTGVYAAREAAAGVALSDQQLQSYADAIMAEHQQFLSKLTSMGIVYVATGDNVVINESEHSYRPHEFHYVYNGIGLQVPGTAISTIAGMPEVAAVYPNWPKQYALLDTSVAWIQAKKVWSQLGVKGEGMRIAVIDTGIDWTHPAFGGFLTVPNQKVIFAMTFTAGTVMDDFGHGTHVSGIAAGDSYKNTPRGDSLIEGVAPRAFLMAYKVLTASGSGLSASVVQAINDAAQNNVLHQRAHVINLSLGSTSGDPNSADSVAVNNAAQIGVVPAVSAGNSGPGESTIGSPGSAKNALTVGANNDDSIGYFLVKVTSPPGQRQDIQAQMFSNSLRFPSNPAIYTNYVFCGLMATPADCLPANVQGKIALIERGTATFTLKGRNAELAGARAAIIYNNVPGPFTGFMEPGIGIPVAAISREDGLYVRGLGFDVTGVSLATLLLDPNGVFAIDQIAGFSSRGPNDDLRIKPSVLAPGVDTFSSTVLASAPVVAMGNPEGYTEASGTSMAAPHVAGAAALLRQIHPDWNAFDVRAALMNTGIRIYDLGGKILRVMDQGAGRIDVFEAATAQALLTDTRFKDGAYSFGRVTHQFEVLTLSVAFNLKSAATSTVTYTPSVEFTTASSGMTASFSQPSIILTPSTTVGFTFTWTVDGKSVPDGDYDAWIFLTATGGSEVLHAPLWVRLVTVASLTPPILDDPGELDDDGDYTLTWGAPSFPQHVHHYRLQEATAFTTAFADNADLITQNWNVPTTWTRSGARFFSSMFSFFSGQGPLLDSSLVLSRPVHLPTGGATLSWWSFEDTEPGFDFIHVDASGDGSSWTNLFRTSGTCPAFDPTCPEDFQLRSVDLSAFAGGPVFIRFRYTTDELIDVGFFEGWYIDDIEITTANWQDIGQPTGQSFTVQDRPEGAYFYRVAAVYTNQEQGPYSNVVDMTVRHSGSVTSVLLRSTGDPKKDAVTVTYFSKTGNAKLVIENFGLRELKVTINGKDIGVLSNELNRKPTGTIEIDVSSFVNPGKNTMVFVPGGKRGQATVTIMDTPQ